MIAPTVLWPSLLGVSFLVAGFVTYRGDPDAATRLVAFGPAFVGAALAAFAGEHFTAATSLAKLVPAWLPGRLFIAYLVGSAHLAAALSIVLRRYVRWSALFLALMFALFVLLMDLPAAIANPGVRIGWSLAARQATFSIGALALFAIQTQGRSPQSYSTLAAIARLWTAVVLVFYGLENVLFPQFSPGVPSMARTAAWVPLPTLIAEATGILLIACGITMLVKRFAAAAVAACGWSMVALTIALYVPQFVVARSVPQHVLAINLVFDTLLFAGMMLVISRALSDASNHSERSEESPGRGAIPIGRQDPSVAALLRDD